ncbi:MAG: neutral zinc metallopeptidase [Dermabacter sp.]|nr:neutral zinc metallopeptidase [Dermabacter sp.]
MTFNPQAEIRSDNTRRRTGGARRGGAIALGGGGVGTLVLVLVLMFAGVDPTALLGDGTSQGPASSQGVSDDVLTECATGADANLRDDCLVQATVESANSLWSEAAPAAGIDFVLPTALIFDGSVATACGTATAAVGPFYCPADQSIYVDVSFFGELESRFGASGGQLAKSYVVAHEYGHHIQAVDGTMTRIDRSQTGPQSDQVRLELQADCYAGMWARHAATTTDENGQAMLMPLTDQDVDDALSAASAVGDDHIQGEVAGGQVRPDTWTHGSSEQRRAWFVRGYNEGTYAACDTFSPERV